jgi:hypothetical protein
VQIGTSQLELRQDLGMESFADLPALRVGVFDLRLTRDSRRIRLEGSLLVSLIFLNP